MRLVLADAAAHAANEAFEITGRSINDLPEYFLSVSIARFVHQHFKTLTFSMEDSVSSICNQMAIDYDFIERPGNVDIAVRSQRTGQVKHIIELKRSYGLDGHYADIERLADFCMLAPVGNSLSTNYMVLMTAATLSTSNQREERIKNFVDETYHGRIALKREIVKFCPSMKSTRPSKKRNRQLTGEVWEVRYIG